MREPCIAFTPGAKMCMLREDFLRICEGDHVAAIVLNQMRHRYENKLEHQVQARTANQVARMSGEPDHQDEELWVYMAVAEMQQDLMGLFGEKAVAAAFNGLVHKGFLLARTNPRYRWDKVRQYLFQAEAVQKAINQPQNCGLVAEIIQPQNCGVEDAELRDRSRINAAAIPRSPEQGVSSRDIPDSLPITSAETDLFGERPARLEFDKPVKASKVVPARLSGAKRSRVPVDPRVEEFVKRYVAKVGAGYDCLWPEVIRVFAMECNPDVDEAWRAFEDWYCRRSEADRQTYGVKVRTWMAGGRGADAIMSRRRASVAPPDESGLSRRDKEREALIKQFQAEDAKAAAENVRGRFDRLEV